MRSEADANCCSAPHERFPGDENFLGSFRVQYCLPDVVEFLKGFARLPLMSPSGEIEVPGKVREAASIHALGR
jgi:hypothetical protein